MGKRKPTHSLIDCRPWLAGNRWSPAGCMQISLYLPFFFSFFPNFWALWSTPPHWLQHMSALPRLLLKTLNTHNFWSIGPKIMKFVLTWSLLRDICSQKLSKNLKINWVQVTLPKTGLVIPGTFGLLGVNYSICSKLKSIYTHMYWILFQSIYS
jgi:hypothetical protein